MRFVTLRLALASVGMLFCCLTTAFGQTDGIFADFTTSMGSFTCRLDYAVAPKAVANFVGLATGERGWLDLNTGLARTNKFYDGLLFHRVVTNFMIQGGSPNAKGTDGPGYAFTDEFSPTARFDSAGVLGMANSGTNSNGAQFFITVEPTPFLNDKHTVFGKVTGGLGVAVAISKVPTNSASRPLTDVVIQQVRIRRVGSAAQAFNIQAQNLPLVTNLNSTIASGTGVVSLTFTNRQFADTRFYSSTNLAAWEEWPLGIELTPPATNKVWLTNDMPKRFFRFAQVQYPASTLAPRSVGGRQLKLTFSPTQVITVNFDAGIGGTYTFGTISGQVEQTWIQEPYRGRLAPIYFSGLNPYAMVLTLNFSTATAGSFSGTGYWWEGTGPLSGNFTLQ